MFEQVLVESYIWWVIMELCEIRAGLHEFFRLNDSSFMRNNASLPSLATNHAISLCCVWLFCFIITYIFGPFRILEKPSNINVLTGFNDPDFTLQWVLWHPQCFCEFSKFHVKFYLPSYHGCKNYSLIIPLCRKSIEIPNMIRFTPTWIKYCCFISTYYNEC